MSNIPRRRTRRMAGIALLAAFVVTVPAEVALAAAPTVSSFTPTSGPIGTSVVITGSGFNDSSVATAVTFNGTAATFTVDSDVQITATVPAGATDGPIAVTDSEGTGTSAASFDVTPSPVPTITSFNPTSGPVGTSVVITGTGFTGASAVTFNGTAATFTIDSDTQITATVPTWATDGPIAVTTPGGTVTSATSFDVTGDQVVDRHERRITLHLRRHLVARGRVTATDGFDQCESGVTVKVQRRRPVGWRTVGTDQTNANGAYRERIPDRVGVYRAVAARELLNAGNDVCLLDRSPRVRHRH